MEILINRARLGGQKKFAHVLCKACTYITACKLCVCPNFDKTFLHMRVVVVVDSKRKVLDISINIQMRFSAMLGPISFAESPKV